VVPGASTREQDYERLKQPTLRAVLARLRAHGSTLQLEDVEPFYDDAWLALWQVDAARVTRLPGLLVVVAYRRAIDHLRRHGQHVHQPVEAVAARAADGDLVDRLDDRRRIREFLEAVDELGGRERDAAILCCVQGYRRSEAAAVLGLRERRLKKVMDRASRTLNGAVAEIEAGTRCASYASRNTAFALGLLDPAGGRHAATRRHLDTCAACRADVRRIVAAA
jgi:RNA polymerase sigma factor (sigma-70 family)